MTTDTTVAIPAQRPAPDSQHAEMWALVERAQTGDTEAWAALYRRHHGPVFRFIFFRVHQDRPLAEDLTADVFAKAIRNNIRAFTWQGRDVGAWFTTIARNVVADHYKSAHTRLSLPFAVGADSTAVLFDRPDERRGPERLAEAGAIAEAIQAALQDLSEEQQQVVRLRFYEDLGVAETATAMGRSEGAVKSLLFRATRALARSRALETLR